MNDISLNLLFHLRECESYGVDGAVCLFTSDPTEIVVMAPNAFKLKDSLEHLSRNSEFDIIAEEGGPLFMRHRKGKKISADLKVVLEVLRENEYVPIKETACELLLIGQNLNTVQPDPHASVYAVIPAHLVLDDEECEQIAEGVMDIAGARFSVGGRSPYTRLS